MLQNINIWYFLAHFRKGNNVYQFTIHYSLARFWVFFFNKQLNKHSVSVQYLLLLVEGWGWLSNRSLQSTSISSHYPIEHPNPLHRRFYSFRDWNQFRYHLVENISSLLPVLYSSKIIFLWSLSCSRADCHLYQMNQTLPEVMTIKTTIIIISFCLRASLSALFFSILASTSSSYVSLITPKSRFSSVVHQFYGIINKYLVTNLVMRRRIY